ncbi:MAG: hypothetical protein IK024_02375 [Treponema sp.]|nr:hypothetical protein [Treponema sp.]
MKKVFFITLSLFLFCMTQNCFGQSQSNNTTPEPYSEDEFSQSLKDLRRFEIITLGAMPFITLDAAIAYNGYKYATGRSAKFNPLATADYSQKEMEKIILTSLSISAGIGITDYIINLVKRNKIKKQKSQEDSYISIKENPDAIKIPLPQEGSEEKTEDLE